MKRILFFGIFVFVQQILFGQDYVTPQTASPKALAAYKEGMKHNFAGKNEQALKKFTEAIKIEPKFIEARIQWGAMNEELGRLAEAESGFEQVSLMAPDYSPLVWIALGRVQEKQQKFEKAVVNYRKYINSTSPKKNADLVAKYQKIADGLEFKEVAMRNPVPFNPKLVVGGVNTEQYEEYLPCVSADGQSLFFTRLVGGLEDLYVSHWDSTKNTWGESKILEDICTEQYNEGGQAISPDGRFILWTSCNNPKVVGKCDLFYSMRKPNGTYTAPRNFGAPISTSAWESQPSISADNRALYFSADRTPDRNRDIFVSFLQPNGTWSAPVSVGDSVNTTGDDQAPYIHPDGQTLYFTSDGHPGVGKSDLFFSRLQPDGKWGKPKNLGYPINTPNADATLTVSLDGKTAYFMRSENKKLDIYSFDLYEAARPKPVTYVKAIVRDAQTREKLSAILNFRDNTNEKDFLKAQTDEEGAFLICLPLGKNYGLSVSKNGYFFHSENFDLKEIAKLDKPFLLEILMKKLPDETKPSEKLPDTGGGAIVLRNVFFETGSAALRPESTTELLQLKDLLDKNPTLKIRIQGHTDNVGSDAANLQLSESRARAVQDFLIQKGVSSGRLSSKGFGEAQPIASNDTPDGRQQNRRTEFVVVN